MLSFARMRPPSVNTAFAGLAIVSVFGLATCGDTGGKGSKFCEVAKASGKSLGNRTDRSALSEAADAIEEMLKVAPTEIKGDLQTLADGFDKLKDVDLSDPTAAAAALEEADRKQIDTADGNLTRFLEQKCGINPW